MKKRYTKPEIFYESFYISQNVGASCEITDSKDPRLLMTGALGGIDGYAFSISCEVDITNGGGDGNWNGVCYHVAAQPVDNPVNFHAS